MKHFAVIAAATALLVGAGAAALATNNAQPPQPRSDLSDPMIDGQAMLRGVDLADNVTVSPEHSVLTVYLEETNLDATLKEKGPLTLFAPTDKAFSLAGILGGRSDLTKLMSYHVVRGRLDSKTLLAMIGQAGGRVSLKTLDGGILVASLNGPANIALMDEHGQTANISIYDIYARNGVMQVIDHVMKPADLGQRPVLTSQAQ